MNLHFINIPRNSLFSLDTWDPVFFSSIFILEQRSLILSLFSPADLSYSLPVPTPSSLVHSTASHFPTSPLHNHHLYSAAFQCHAWFYPLPSSLTPCYTRGIQCEDQDLQHSIQHVLGLGWQDLTRRTIVLDETRGWVGISAAHTYQLRSGRICASLQPFGWAEVSFDSTFQPSWRMNLPHLAR